MEIPLVKDDQHFSKLVEANRYLVAYFTAQWCGPCQAIKPLIEGIYNDSKYNKIQIVKIDLDSNQKLAGKLNVTSIPTFIFYEAGKETDRLKGVSQNIERRINELNTKALVDPQLKERANGLGEAKKYTGIEELIPKGFEVLNDTIHTGETVALNVMPLRSGGEVKNVFKFDASNSAVYSDADSQALFFVPLNNISKVYSVLIKFVKPDNAKDCNLDESELQEESQRPSLLKIWPNKPSILSFDETLVGDAPHVEQINGDESEWHEIKLKYVRFQNVQNLNIFVDGEDEDSHTLIEKIVLVGVSGENKEQGSVHQEEE